MWTLFVRYPVYVNSWNRQKTENAGLWPQYVGDAPGVVLQSTYGELIGALPHRVFAGEIEYVHRGIEKPKIDTKHVVDSVFYKRKEYEQEKEIRLAIYTQPTPTPPLQNVLDWIPDTPCYHHVRVNLSELIRAIHVTPGTKQWGIDVVVNLLRV